VRHCPVSHELVACFDNDDEKESIMHQSCETSRVESCLYGGITWQPSAGRPEACWHLRFLHIWTEESSSGLAVLPLKECQELARVSEAMADDEMRCGLEASDKLKTLCNHAIKSLDYPSITRRCGNKTKTMLDF